MKTYSKEFIKQLKNSNPKSQKLLFTELYGTMYRVCNRYILQQDEAEDCVMKGFMKAFQKLDNFEYVNEESLFFWIRKIMVNESLMVVRKKSSLFITAEENLPEVSIDAAILNKLDAADLNEMIKGLPDGYRTVFLLFVVEGYQHKEIAEMLGISENTSKSQLIKAKIKLKAMLEKREVLYARS